MTKQPSFLKHFFGVFGWLALGALTFGLIFGTVGYFLSRTAERLANDGVTATATITNKRRVTDDDDTDYEITYTFPFGQEEVQDRQDVSYSFYGDVSVGDALPVRYWSKDPSVSEIEEGATAQTGMVFRYLGYAFGVVGLLLAHVANRRAQAALWMARHGMRREVVITGHEATSVTINDQPQWKAKWLEPDGREGASRMRLRERLPEVGARIMVLIDPEHRRPSLWEEDL